MLLGEGDFQVYFCFLLLLCPGLVRTALCALQKELGVVNEVANKLLFLIKAFNHCRESHPLRQQLPECFFLVNFWSSSGERGAASSCRL